MAEEKFSVIIVGAGPVGLTAAHALSKAGIDFTLLERRETIEENIGATIVLWPHAIRVLAQLGLEEKLRSIGSELITGSHQLHSGKVYNDTKFPQIIKDHFGTYGLVFARADLVSLLYRSLSQTDQSRILPNKKVTSIKTSNPDPKSTSGGSDRVTVTCSDGTTYSSTIVIGADGVHSAARQAIASPNDPDLFKTQYRVMWFAFPRPAAVPATSAFECHGQDLSSQLLNTEASSFMLVYEPIPAPPPAQTKSDNLKNYSYTPDDIESLASKASHLPVGLSSLTLKDVWPLKSRPPGMTNLQEGITPRWSCGSGRIVLIGDAAHKITPNQGFGLNDGIIDVVALTNALTNALSSFGTTPPSAALSSSSSAAAAVSSATATAAAVATAGLNLNLNNNNNHNDKHESSSSSSIIPTQQSLQSAFDAYQAQREKWTAKNMHTSGFTTRLSTWRQKWVWWLVRAATVLWPGFDGWLVGTIYDPLIGESGLVFERIDGLEMDEEPFVGKVGWKVGVPLRTTN